LTGIADAVVEKLETNSFGDMKRGHRLAQRARTGEEAARRRIAGPVRKFLESWGGALAFAATVAGGAWTGLDRESGRSVPKLRPWKSRPGPRRRPNPGTRRGSE